MRRIQVTERRARMARRHRLAPGARAGDVVEAARSIVCLHGTDPATVYLSAWSRVDDMALAAAGEIHDAEDHFNAAMIFQHGGELEDFWTARELARVAAEMGHERARWLAAAAYDRWLMHQGKAQRYGTQFIATGGGALHLWEVEETTTDEDRAEWGVPPLADALERVEGRTQPADVRFSPLPPAGGG